MKVFYFLCVLPLILASPRVRDTEHDSHEVGDWENDGANALFGGRGGQRNGVMRLVARISTNGGERRENRWDMSKEEDRYNRPDDRDSEMRHRQVDRRDESGERNDEDMHRHHGYSQRSADGMMQIHGKKEDHYRGDNSDERDHRQESREGMGHRHGGGNDEDYRPHGERGGRHEIKRLHGDRMVRHREERPEWSDQMPRRHGGSNNGRRHGPSSRHGGSSVEENDNNEREYYRVDHHRGKAGEDYRAQWDKHRPHRDSSEEDLRREYVRFFGRLSFNDAQGENILAENQHRRDQTRGSRRHSHANQRMNRHDDQENKEMDEIGEESAREIEKRLKMTMEQLYKKDQYELAKVLTLSFLRMCECDSDDATDLLKSFIARAERPENGTRVLEVPNVPDFKGNTTARAEFYRSLTEEQMSLLFGHDLVKSMCTGAKMFLVEAKTFFDKYFPSYNGSILIGVSDIKAPIQQG